MTQDQEQSPDGVGAASDVDERVEDDLLTALSDPRSRAILRSIANRTLTAAELSEALDLPLSTVYRKLDRLVETPLVEETHRLASDGRHPAQYSCPVDRIEVTLSGDGNGRLDIDMSPRSGAAADSEFAAGADR